MTRLGAIFAGGQARRFGSDKGAAVVGGVALIDRVAAQLAKQCEAVMVVGRAWPGLQTIVDAPQPGLGPLGALAGALVHAGEHGFAEVLTSGCDLPELPAGLATLLAPGPSVIAGQPLLGLWPAGLASMLLAHIAGSEDRSMRGWIAAAAARRVMFDGVIANINTPEDLTAYSNRDLAE